MVEFHFCLDEPDDSFLARNRTGSYSRLEIPREICEPL